MYLVLSSENVAGEEFWIDSISTLHAHSIYSWPKALLNKWCNMLRSKMGLCWYWLWISRADALIELFFRKTHIWAKLPNDDTIDAHGNVSERSEVSEKLETSQKNIATQTLIIGTQSANEKWPRKQRKTPRCTHEGRTYVEKDSDLENGYTWNPITKTLQAEKRR